ncbi:MAG: hypothetical protein COA99_08765 [Moraxellaceae bacterium]|nr:MAG: hypothetical protein COA99_08765 [Moraxellaceae bacterium]
MANDPQRHSLVPSFFAERLETMLNRALRYAPGSQAALAELEGDSIALIATHPNLQLLLAFSDNEINGIRVSSYWEETPSAAIKGPLISILFQLGLNKSPGELIASNIQVEGDQDLAQRLATIFRETDLDLEEPLARWVGDVAAHQVGQAARSAFGWLKKTARTLLDDGSHYLREEGRQVVEKEELNHLNDDIDGIRDDYERLEVRVQHLRAKQKPAEGSATDKVNDNVNDSATISTDNPFEPRLSPQDANKPQNTNNTPT